MITRNELVRRFLNACDCVIAAEDMLTQIDAAFGDADHGYTMAKVCNAIKAAIADADSDIQSMLDDAAMAVMAINGGSAVPLWNTWLDGMQEGAPAEEETDIEGVKAIFARGFEELDEMSGAKVGDKTMMDALIPATEAIQAWEGDMDGLFEAAAKAAEAGAENSKNFVSKFGRAKSYGTQTIGTPDAGAVSMKYFFVGLAKK